MTSHIIKDLVSTAQHIADNIVHAAHDLTQNIADIARSNGDKIEHILQQKNISTTRESRHGKECHNIVVNTDGSFFTNNSIDFTRGLLNQVLFGKDGEERMGKAMGQQGELLDKVQNPQQKVANSKAFPLSPIGLVK